MTFRMRFFSASMALALLGGALAGCSDAEAAKPGDDVRTSGSTSSSAAATPSVTSASTATVTPTVTWSPPSPEEQAKAIAHFAEIGVTVKYTDPVGFPKRGITPPPPSMPLAGLNNTEEGAVLTIGFFFDSVYYMAHGGDSSDFKKISSTNCATCSSYTGGFEGMSSMSGYSNMVLPRASALRVVGRDAKGVMEIRGTVKFAPYTTYFPVAGAVATTPDQGGPWTFYLSYFEDGHWIVESAGKS